MSWYRKNGFQCLRSYATYYHLRSSAYPPALYKMSVCRLATVSIQNSNQDYTLKGIIDRLQPSPKEGKVLKNCPGFHKQLAEMAYDLSSSKKFSELDVLIGEMKQANYKLSDGILSTVLKSYVDRKMWLDSFSLIKDVSEKHSKVKHVRLYNYLIGGLANDNRLDEAHIYFQELLQLEREGSFQRNASAKHRTITALLRAFLRAHKQEKSSIIVLRSVLEYMRLFDLRANNENADLIVAAFTRTQKFRVKLTNATTDMKCANCLTDFYSTDQKEERFSKTGDFVTGLIRSQLVDTGRHTVLRHVDRYFENGNWYGFVVDVANVLYYGSQGKDKQLTMHSFTRLANILESLTKIITSHSSRQNIMLVLPQSNHKKLADRLANVIGASQRRQEQWNYMDSVRIDTITTKKFDDDLLLLYVTARSDAAMTAEVRQKQHRSSVRVISNDNFVNYSHRLVSSQQQQQRYDMLLWLRHKIKHFDLEGLVDLSPYTPNVSYDNCDVMHIKCADSRWICIRSTNTTQ